MPYDRVMRNIQMQKAHELIHNRQTSEKTEKIF